MLKMDFHGPGEGYVPHPESTGTIQFNFKMVDITTYHVAHFNITPVDSIEDMLAWYNASLGSTLRLGRIHRDPDSPAIVASIGPVSYNTATKLYALPFTVTHPVTLEGMAFRYSIDIIVRRIMDPDYNDSEIPYPTSETYLCELMDIDGVERVSWYAPRLDQDYDGIADDDDFQRRVDDYRYDLMHGY